MTEAVKAEQAAPRRKFERRGLGNIYEHRHNWWLDVRVKGTRHRRKLGPVKLLEKRQARVIADEEITKLLMPKAPEPLPVKGMMPFSEFAKKFLSWRIEKTSGWQRYRGKTIEHTPLKHAVAFFHDTPLNKITAGRIEDF